MNTYQRFCHYIIFSFLVSTYVYAQNDLGDQGVNPSPKLVISELVAIDSRGLTSNVGDSFDWIEVMNVSKQMIFCGRYFLSDNESMMTKWKLPDIYIVPGSRIVFMASGRNELIGNLEYHTNFKLNARGETILLSRKNRIDGFSIESKVTYPSQYPGYSYAYDRASSTYSYSTPNPGKENTIFYKNRLPEPLVYPKLKWHSKPFMFSLHSSEPGVVFKYTTDGSLPGLNNGTKYINPIKVDKTSTFRIIALKQDYISSVIVSTTYLFPKQIALSKNMNNKITHSAVYKDKIEQSLASLKSISIILPHESLHGENGIITNSTKSGRKWERECSFEIIDPNGNFQTQANCAIRVHGGYSRYALKKLSYRMYFRKKYGVPQLDYSVFKNSGQTKFKKLILRGGFNDIWQVPWNDQARYATYIRDQFTRESHIAMGQYSGNGQFYHLYLNGAYRGIYHVVERPDEDFLTSHWPGEEENAEVVKSVRFPDGGLSKDGHVWETIHGNAKIWQECMNISGGGDHLKPGGGYAPHGVKDNETFMGKNRYNLLQDRLDLDSLSSYMILNHYLGNVDWPFKNWYAGKIEAGKYMFFCWDSESGLAFKHSLQQDVTTWNRSGTPSGIFHKMKKNSELRILFADLVYKNIRRGGPLSADSSLKRWNSIKKLVYSALIAESARWYGYNNNSVGYTRNVHWKYMDSLLTKKWFPDRTKVLIRQYRNHKSNQIYPSLDPPILKYNNMELERKCTIHLSNAEVVPIKMLSRDNTEIYYTTNGVDPRVSGGAIHTDAQRYDSNFEVKHYSLIKARSIERGEWSALADSRVFLNYSAPTSENVEISELMYNPRSTNENESSNYEFLEINNTSNRPIDLQGAYFTRGIKYTFKDKTILYPRKPLVLVKSKRHFQERYDGIPYYGQFTEGKLNNNGERITMCDYDSYPIIDFFYSDKGEWPKECDGHGYSLVRDKGRLLGWSSSIKQDGSPSKLEGKAEKNDDIDGDFIPDYWEKLYFHNLSQNAGGDNDDDGIKNIDEYLMGTDPTEKTAPIKIISIKKKENQILLELIYPGEKQFSIENSRNLLLWKNSRYIQLELIPDLSVKKIKISVPWQRNTASYFRIKIPL